MAHGSFHRFRIIDRVFVCSVLAQSGSVRETFRYTAAVLSSSTKMSEMEMSSSVEQSSGFSGFQKMRK